MTKKVKTGSQVTSRRIKTRAYRPRQRERKKGAKRINIGGERMRMS